MIVPGTKPVQFNLRTNYKNEFLTRKVKWNFKGLSEFTFYRTYSRIKENGKLENWNDCVIRVIEGMFTVLKTHTKNNHIVWEENKAQKLAQEAADRMFSFKWLPPGRGLWIMGTPFMWEKGGAALNNCGFVSTDLMGTSEEETVLPFKFLMDMSMLGVGVGFDTKGAKNNISINGYVGEETFVVEDTRESWIEFITSTIKNGIYGGPYLIPDVNKVRGPGELIRGFGGVSSGPRPLVVGARGIGYLLKKRKDELLKSTDIVDIMNIIGKIVVAGNVRRTAEISFADSDDIDFSNMKNWDDFPVEMGSEPPEELREVSEEDYILYKEHIFTPTDNICKNIVEKYIDEEWAFKFGGWRWTSNNSIFAKVGMDYTKFENSIKKSGEPGFAWLDLMRSHGRLVDPENNIDHKVAGGNPCKSLKSLILSDKGYITFKEALKYDTLTVLTPNGWKPATRPFKTGENRNVWKITLRNGSEIFGTENHLQMNKDGEWKRIDELKVNDVLKVDYSSIHDSNIDNINEYEDGITVGWLWADGSTTFDSEHTYPTIDFSIGENEFDYIFELERIVDKESVPHHQKPETCSVIKTRNATLFDKIHSYGYNFNDKNDLSHILGKSKEYKLGFIRAAFTCDGSVRKSNSVELYSINENALKVLQTVLFEFGIKTNICVHNNENSYVAKDGKIRNNKTCFKLCVPFGQYLNIGFLSDYKNNLLKERNHFAKDYRPNYHNTIASIEPNYSVEDVYDITVDDESHAFIDNGAITHNCLEQSLESYELCCLVENFPANCDDYWDFQRTLKFSYLYAKTVTLFATHFDRTNSVMIRNRRIGGSVSGVTDAIWKFGRYNFISNFLNKGYAFIKHLDTKYSDWLGVRESIKKTSVKPSGTTSLVGGSFGPGVHHPKMKSGYRLIRIANNSELIPLLKAANYRIEASINDPLYTSVVYFPWLTPDGMISEEDVNIWEQFKLAADLQYWWADNQVSCTVEFKQHEAENGEISRCLEAFDGQLKGISLLPKSEGIYPQMPFTTAPRKEIEEYISTLNEIDFSILTSEGEASDANKFCDSSTCLI
jgi:hypothetical protein